MNPCVDCRIYMFKIAKRYMEEIGAGFIVTGEVLEQRPMSQRRRPLHLIETDSGLEGLLLRPLSAHHLEPTMPELLGVVDRAKLLGLSGRSRSEQISLARQFGVSEYSQAAGGCLLTDETFANKVKDLFAHETHPTTKDMELLTTGRHLRLSPTTKVILGRNEFENLLLEGYADEQSTFISPRFPGPAALVVGTFDETVQMSAGRLIAQHTKKEKLPAQLTFRIRQTVWTVERTQLAPEGAPSASVSGGDIAPKQDDHLPAQSRSGFPAKADEPVEVQG